MSKFNIEVAGGSSVRLKTEGKYCDRDIVVTATGGGGSGVKIATGSFTQVSTSASTPKITHNLGTKKIVCLCWIPNDVTVVPTAGYQIFAAAFINAPAFFGSNIQVDCTGYNSKFTAVSNVAYSNLSLGAAMRSPWTSQANFTAPNIAAGPISGSSVTEDTLVFKSSSNFIGGYTYNYIILGVE